MKSVKFKIGNGPYCVGDIATFDDRIAGRLIQAGYAEEYQPAKTEKSGQAVRQRAKLEQEDKQMTSSSKKRSYETKGT